MTNGIVFILHSPAEAARAAELAAALSPLVALPMAVGGERRAAFGSGALCVILLDAVLAAQPDFVTGSAPVANAILCVDVGVAIPPSLAGYTRFAAPSTLEGTVGALRDLVAQTQCLASDQAARQSRTAPVLGKRAEIREPGRNSMVARSAWGLAATVVVASVAAPAIGDRAGALAVSADLDRAKTAQAMSEAQVASLENVAMTEPQELPPPPLAELLDHIDRTVEPPLEVAVVASPNAAVASVELAPAENVETIALGATPDALVVVLGAVDAPRQATAPMAAETAAALQTSNAASEPAA